MVTLAEGADPRARSNLIRSMQEIARRSSRRRFFAMFPDDDFVAPPAAWPPGSTDGIYWARHRYVKHMEFFEAGKDFRERAAIAGNRVGKALRNGTPVATPAGWRAIDSLSVGDEVIAGDGSICRVTGVYPQGIKPLYRMVFDGRDEIDCCSEHLWLWQAPKSRYPTRISRGKTEPNPSFGLWQVSQTSEIIAAIGSDPAVRQRAVMPSSPPWKLPNRSAPIDPYALGILLGDGHLGDEQIGFSTADAEIVSSITKVMPAGVYVRHLGRVDYGIRVERNGQRHPVITALRSLGLHGLRSAEKFVPDSYKLNSQDIRLDILRGLMDSDGSISATGTMEFSSISRRLADDVLFLVHSLGGRGSIEERQTHFTHKGERRPGAPSFRVRIRLNVCPFRLGRKAVRWTPRHNTTNRILHRIVEAPAGEATCISVDHQSRTFVTAHGIVTHNTWGMGAYEVTCHLTGLYPPWWPGRVFSRPGRWWVAGKTNETTRDIIQAAMLGEVTGGGVNKFVSGTGMVPGDTIKPRSVKWKQGIADYVDTVRIHHASGHGFSTLGFKSYEQGRGSFEGTSQDGIWFDEEPPLDVYGEALIRTATTNGIIMITFTPLEGLSDVVMQFIPSDQLAG